MIHHKKETTSNPKNPRRKPLVDRWKFKDFVERQKWMEDGLNVSRVLTKSTKNSFFFMRFREHKGTHLILF